MFTTSNHPTHKNFTLLLVLVGLTAFTASASAGPRVQTRPARMRTTAVSWAVTPTPSAGRPRPIIIVTPPNPIPQPVQGPL